MAEAKMLRSAQERLKDGWASIIRDVCSNYPGLGLAGRLKIRAGRFLRTLADLIDPEESEP